MKEANDSNKLAGSSPHDKYGTLLMEIMSMHPYGSYAWKKSQTPSHENSAGKGEAALSRALQEAYNEGQEDDTGSVNLPSKYYKYLVDNGMNEFFSDVNETGKFVNGWE